MDIQRTVVDMAYAIRGAVRPHIGKQSSKKIVGITESGDGEFAIDEVAEKVIEDFISDNGFPVAYYSEGRGLVGAANPEFTLIIDPIDGTRPAMVGLEMGVVSIAAVPHTDDPRLSDVAFGCILELKTERMYTAARGEKARILDGGAEIKAASTDQTDLDSISWSFDIAGRPSRLIARILQPLIDRSSIKGGVFIFNAAAYSLTRMASGQLDAYVDAAVRILRDFPQHREEYLGAGLGNPFGLMPYDIAAAVLIAESAGCVVTDSYGNPLSDIPLLDTSEKNILSCVAASNPALHEKLLIEVEAGIRSLG